MHVFVKDIALVNTALWVYLNWCRVNPNLVITVVLWHFRHTLLDTQHHVYAVALYTVLWSVVAKCRKWPFSAHRRTKPLNRSKQKFAQLITSAGPPSRPKFIMIGRGSRRPIWVKLSTGGVFFFRWLLGQAHSQRRALESHILYINRRGFAQGCAFWASIRVIPWGNYSPKAPHVGDVNGDFQLNRLRA
jgi:hypothetical protein